MLGERRSASQMVEIFRGEPELLKRLKSEANPFSVLEETAKKAERATALWTEDRLLYRIAVIVLSLLSLIAAVGSIVLVRAGQTTPEVLVALGSAAVGALVGLFAPPPPGK